MRPAFSSPLQAVAFAILLLLLLLAPALAGKKFLPSRQEIYSSVWWADGDYPFFYQQIFQERSDIDVLFIGASHTHTAYLTPYVQEQLSKALGRPAAARTMGWGWTGYDQLYFISQDLLAHRKVKLLFFDDYYDYGGDVPHPLAPRVFRFGDNAGALDGLPFSFKATYYFASIAGMPRNLLSLVRTNRPVDLYSEKDIFPEVEDCAPNPAIQLGALTENFGFSPDKAAGASGHPPFVAFTPHTDAKPSDVLIYSEATKTNFVFASGSIPPMQLMFAKKFAAMAINHGCKLVLLHIPTFDERHLTVIPEPEFWPKALQANVIMAGIPPTTMFKGLNDDEIRKLYSDPAHLNKNGQAYFTALVTPTVIKIYESEVQNP